MPESARHLQLTISAIGLFLLGLAVVSGQIRPASAESEASSEASSQAYSQASSESGYGTGWGTTLVTPPGRIWSGPRSPRRLLMCGNEYPARKQAPNDAIPYGTAPRYYANIQTQTKNSPRRLRSPYDNDVVHYYFWSNHRPISSSLNQPATKKK
jgi:hypothetical protein